MKVTLEMVLTRFFAQHKEANLFSKITDTQMHHALLGIQLLPRHMENLSADYLYVTDQFYYSAQISRDCRKVKPDNVYPPDIAETDLSFIVFGSEAPDSGDLRQNAIFIQTDMELAEGFNALQNVYAEFIEWGRQLDFAIFRNADFQEFIDISEEMIACPILVYDPALKLLAYSRMYPGLDDRIFQTAIANGYLDLETVKYFEKERIFAQMDHTGSAVGEPDNFRMHADFARAINIRNELAVYCILLYTSEYPRSYINELYQIFCNSIEHLLEKQHADFLKNRSVTDYFLMDLLDNPDTPPEQIKERIYYNDLDYEGNYIVICLHSDIKQKPSENYFIQLLRNNMINCRIFAYHGGIVILYHLPKFRETDYRDYLRDQLHTILKDFADRSITLYFSKPFTTIGQFAEAYQQAESLHQMNLSMNDTMYCFYEDHWLKYLIGSTPQKEKSFSFCEPSLLQMLHADTKKSRQQLEILYEYFRCDRKLTDVAGKLGMHRNNVIYHVKQISEEFHLNFDDPDVCLRLLMSFEVLKFSKLFIR